MATEIDSFTQRYQPTKDATQRINEITNELIHDALIAANNSSPSQCNEKQMYRMLHHTLAGFGAGTWSALEEKVEQDHQIEQRKPPVSHSIYKKVSSLLAPALALTKLGATINMNGYTIGTDKLGHFVDQGYEHFSMAYLHGKGEDTAIRNGEFTESTYYGLLTTGIYSYGDLAANYLGMQFWASLTGHYKDTDTPLLSCINNQWVQNEPFRWEDYIDGALDEGINCTDQSNQVWAQIEPEILQLEQKDSAHRYQCPIQPELCPQLVQKYGTHAAQLISPKCR